MCNEPTRWYKEHETVAKDGLARVHDITAKSLGTKNGRRLCMSGAETWGFLLFLVHCLEKYRSRLSDLASNLLVVGKTFVRMQEVFGSGEANLPTSIVHDAPVPR